MKNVKRFLKKLNIELPYDPAIPLLGIYPEEILIIKDAPYVHRSTVYNCKDKDATKRPSTD